MIILVSQNGYVKRMHLSISMKHRGSEGMTLNRKWFRILREPEGKNDLVLLTNLGGIIRFPLNEIRPMGNWLQESKQSGYRITRAYRTLS